MLVTTPQLIAKLPTVTAYVDNKRAQIAQESDDNRIKSARLMLCLSDFVTQLQMNFPTANLSPYIGGIHQGFSDFVEADIVKGDGNLAALCLIARSFKELCLFNQVVDGESDFPSLAVHDYCFDYSETNMLRTLSHEKDQPRLVNFRLLSSVFYNLHIGSVITDSEGKVVNNYYKVFNRHILDTPTPYLNNPKPKLTITNEYNVHVETPVGLTGSIGFNRLHHFPEIHKEVSYYFYKVLEDNGVTPDVLKSSYEKLKNELRDVHSVISKHHEHPDFYNGAYTHNFPYSHDSAMSRIYADPFQHQLIMERSDRAFSIFASKHTVYLKSNEYGGALLTYTSVDDKLTYSFKEGREIPTHYEIDIEKPFLFSDVIVPDGAIKFELTLLTSIDRYIRSIQRYKVATNEFFEGPPTE